MATRPTVGGSDGTWGSELNAHLDVSLDTDGKVDDGAAQTTSAAPGADAEIANKKYVDDQDDTKEDVLVTQATAGIFGSWTALDSIGGTLVKNEVYKVGSDGFISMFVALLNGGLIAYTDGSNPPTTIRQRVEAASTQIWRSIMIPVKKNDYWKVTSSAGALTIYWLPIGTGTCVKQ